VKKKGIYLRKQQKRCEYRQILHIVVCLSIDDKMMMMMLVVYSNYLTSEMALLEKYEIVIEMVFLEKQKVVIVDYIVDYIVDLKLTVVVVVDLENDELV
jgi:hypothetical protein